MSSKIFFRLHLVLLFGLTSLIIANAQYSFKWAKSIGGISEEDVLATTIDASGNIYMTGYFDLTVDFDPGVNIFSITSLGQADVFIVKLSASGDLLWAKRVGGNTVDRGWGIAVNNLGEVYVTGTFMNTADFDPDNGTYSLTANGWSDIFILKLNASGNFMWVKKIGGSLYDGGLAIALDTLGSIYCTGYFANTVDFDPGPGIQNLSTNITQDVFVLKLDNNGSFLWVKKLGGPSQDRGTKIKIANDGDIYVSGIFEDTADFNPGPGVFNLVSAGSYDAFICKLKPNGAFKWAKRIGSTGWDEFNSIDIDQDENVYIASNLSGNVDFDPNSGQFILSSTGSSDMALLKLDSLGALQWAKRIGGTGPDHCFGIAVSSTQELYATGTFHNTVDFNPGSGTFNLTAHIQSDIFVLKLNAQGVFVFAKNIGGSAENWGRHIVLDTNNNIYTNGFYYGTSDFNPDPGIFNMTSVGNKDIFIIKMLNCVPTSFTDTVIACDSYSSPSGNYTWTSSGTYVDVMPYSLGCDSVITIHLTILNSSSTTISSSGCRQYTSPSGKILTTSGTYIDTLTNVFGCDSLININLTIDSVDTSINNNSPTLTANAVGVSYQWIDCQTGQAILGANSAVFTAFYNGQFACIINSGVCADTSDCYEVNNISLSESINFRNVHVYPNPTDGFLKVVSDLYLDKLELTDISGRILLTRKNQPSELDLHMLPKGVYLLKISTAQGVIVQRVVKW